VVAGRGLNNGGCGSHRTAILSALVNPRTPLAAMRNLAFHRHYTKHPAGAVLAVCGDTRVLCTASIETDLPPHRKGTGGGWLTAEYAMLPGSTSPRKRRDGVKQDGRSVEIQRLIGRSLRAAVDIDKLGPVTIALDCDVIQADGGTRTTAISGAWVALVDALGVLARKQNKAGPEHYLLGQVAAISVGIVGGQIIADLDYANDSKAEVDMNVVMRGSDFIEVQGTGEQGAFNRDQLNQLLDAAAADIANVMTVQRAALAKP
jgi:ribonuclease PH